MQNRDCELLASRSLIANTSSAKTLFVCFHTEQTDRQAAASMLRIDSSNEFVRRMSQWNDQ
jgi:hypothetical protein